MNTETQLPRLIDANALKERISQRQRNTFNDTREDESFSDYAWRVTYEEIDSAPTVETTDDVLKAIGRHPTLFLVNEKWNAYVMQNPSEVYKGDTPIEAVKKLEASLNRK